MSSATQITAPDPLQKDLCTSAHGIYQPESPALNLCEYTLKMISFGLHLPSPSFRLAANGARSAPSLPVLLCALGHSVLQN